MMIEYRVECHVDRDASEEWEQYFINTHLDEVFETGCFTRYSFLKDTELSDDHIRFVTSYFVKSIDKLEYYNLNFASALKADINAKFGGKFKAFRGVYRILSTK